MRGVPVTKLLVDISAHGFGHLAQTAPILAALRSQLSQAEFIVRTGVPAWAVAGRVNRSLRVVPSGIDFGLVMNSPFEVNREASFSRYALLHRNYDAVIEDLATWVHQEKFSAVVSNVSYTAVAAAHRLGIPSLAVSSLNWLDLFNHYCGSFAGADTIARQIQESYGKASVFCRLSPGMPMPTLATTNVTDVIARPGLRQREELLARFGRGQDTRIVVFALGGMSDGAAAPSWDADLGDDNLLFGPHTWGARRPWTPVSASGLRFLDLIASSDLVITKPGYGIVTEVAIAGVPTLLLTRGDWPEEPYLVDWLHRHGRCEFLRQPLNALDPSVVFACIEKLAEKEQPLVPKADGERYVVAILRRMLQS